MATREEVMQEIRYHAPRKKRHRDPFSIECEDGWMDLVLETHVAMKRIASKYQIRQIKQKLGELRYYVGNVSPEQRRAARPMLDRAAERSRKICEICGAPGRIGSKGGWWQTRCEAHAPEGFTPFPQGRR